MGFQITKIFAEKSTPNCGVYIINDNNLIYDYSWGKNVPVDFTKISQLHKKQLAISQQRQSEKQLLLEQFR